MALKQDIRRLNMKKSRQRQKERRDAINLLIKEEGLTYNEAAFVVDGGTIPTETIDNAQVNLTLEKKLIDPGIKGGKQKNIKLYL